MEAELLLREITDYCRRVGVAESTFGRLAVNDGKFVNRLRDGGRITTTTFERVRSYIANAPASGHPGERPFLIPPAAAGRPAAKPPASPPSQGRNFRFFDNRQKYLPVRQHLLREGGDRPAGRDGARKPPSAAAGGTPLRRGRRRRHRAHPDDAGDAQPLPHDAVLHRGQGDQPRGRAARAREDARPLLRAPGLGAGHDQPLLPRGALAGPRVGDRGDQPRLARGRAYRHHRPRVRGADHRARAFPRRALARARQPDEREPGVRAPGGAGASTARTTASCSTRSSRAAAGRPPTTTSSSPRSRTGRGRRSTSRPRR